jgi:hypothetical protein
MSENQNRKGGPRERESQHAEGTQQYFTLSQFQQSFDKNAFDALIKSQGVLCEHMRACLDPSGMASRGDNHAVQARRASSDGYIYKSAGTFWASFSSNSSNWEIETQGLLKHDTVQMTFSRSYEDCPDKEVVLAPYDRIYLKNIELHTITNQYVEASTTGIDRLQYPATHVESIMDADGKDYKCGVHFEITNEGWLKWLTQERPGFNIKTGRGTVYAVRYRYTPYYIIARLLHEIRVTQITDPNTFERSVERMPYQAMAIREHILFDVNRDPNSNIMDNRYQSAWPVSDDDTPGNKSGPAGML